MELNVRTKFPVHKACWVPDDAKNNEFKEFKRIKQSSSKDKYGQLVFLADSDFTIQMTKNKYPSVKLYFTSEFE
jgi:peptide chain release factor 3